MKKVVLIVDCSQENIGVYECYNEHDYVESDYKNKEYWILKNKFEEFKSKVFNFTADDNLSGLMEYLKEQDLY